VGYLAYTRVGDIKMRVNETMNVLLGRQTLHESNASTFAFLSNAAVAYRSFMSNPALGSGLGSYQISYNKFISQVTDIAQVRMFLNIEDANSLFLRLMSEMGMVGMGMVLYFIFKFHIYRKDDPSGYFWIINNAILAMFMIRLLRSGHYFNGGLFFFVWLYYFSGKYKRLINEDKKLYEHGSD